MNDWQHCRGHSCISAFTHNSSWAARPQPAEDTRANTENICVVTRTSCIMRMIAIIAASHDSAATEAAAVYAKHSTFHSSLNVQPFEAESVCR